MTGNIEQPKYKDQWTILYSNALEELQENVRLCKVQCDRLEVDVTRSTAESIFVTPYIPKAIEPLQPTSERTTLPDGTDIISTASTPQVNLVITESDKLRELKSELEFAKGKKLYAEEILARLQKVNLADTSTKADWIKQTVDQFFQKVLVDYTAYLAQKEVDNKLREDPEAKIHKQTVTNNAFPSLLALVLYPELCTDPNRDQVIASFVDENKAELTILKFKVAEMMLNQARLLGLLPTSSEEIDQQDRKLTTVLQKLNP